MLQFERFKHEQALRTHEEGFIVCPGTYWSDQMSECMLIKLRDQRRLKKIALIYKNEQSPAQQDERGLCCSQG